jgi:hypothetical protein
MLRHRRHASGAMTSCNRPPASPGPLARAWGLTRVAPSIGPTRGVRRHQQWPRHPVVPGGPVPWTSLPAPLWRGEGDQCLRHRCRRLFLLRPCDRSRNTRRLACRRRACRCLRHPLRTPPCHRGHSRLERLGRCEGGDSRCHPVNKKAKE